MCKFRITDATYFDHLSVYAFATPLSAFPSRPQHTLTRISDFGPSKRPLNFKIARSHWSA